MTDSVSPFDKQIANRNYMSPLGFKLVLIYAKWGTIETVDHIRKRKYVQKFKNNLNMLLTFKNTPFSVGITFLACVGGAVELTNFRNQPPLPITR